MGLEVGEIPNSERRSAVMDDSPLTEAEAISLLLRGPQGPAGVTEPFFLGTYKPPMRRRPERLAKRRAKNKVAKRSRRTNRSSK
jgi:hypothetical protein